MIAGLGSLWAAIALGVTALSSAVMACDFYLCQHGHCAQVQAYDETGTPLPWPDLGPSPGLDLTKPTGDSGSPTQLDHTGPINPDQGTTPTGDIWSPHDLVTPVGNGHIVYMVGKTAYRIQASQGSKAENLTQALNNAASASDSDESLSVSPDGLWYATVTERYDSGCSGYACLSLVSATSLSGEAVRPGGKLQHPEGQIAVGPGGNVVVWSHKGGPNQRDIFVSIKSGGSWSAAQALTSNSPYSYNDYPTISLDGSKVVFDCGDVPYGVSNTNICTANSGGGGFEVKINASGAAAHHPAFSPQGEVIYEGDYSGEQVWRSFGGSKGSLIAPQFSNDNSPCVLPDGRVVSLYLGQAGIHQIKVMDADGGNYFILMPSIDVSDVGISCGN
jgi:hypothetical protein